MNYFRHCKTVAEIKKEFRRLAHLHHPDHGGDVNIMRVIIEQYKAALKMADGTTETGTDGKPHTYRYNAAVEEELIAKINELLSLKLAGVDIWLIGRWLWVMCDTYPNRQAIKSVGLTWHSKRQAWYWRPPDAASFYNSSADFSALAREYGATLIDKDTRL